MPPSPPAVLCSSPVGVPAQLSSSRSSPQKDFHRYPEISLNADISRIYFKDVKKYFMDMKGYLSQI
jgi:hypothetical protein